MNEAVITPAESIVQRQHNGKQYRPICGAVSGLPLQTGNFIIESFTNLLTKKNNKKNKNNYY